MAGNYSQSQKWINMTLKYMFALGDHRVPGIKKNFRFFHIPIDDIIQSVLFEKYQIERLKDTKTEKWSRIDNYELYLEYQKKVREKFHGEIPIEVEFRLFNKGIE